MKLLLAILFTLNLHGLVAQYDINDPRNPDCPCHKYQKLADDEYKQLLARGNDSNKNDKQNITKDVSHIVEAKKSESVREHDVARKSKSKKRVEKLRFKKQAKHRSKRKGTIKNPFHFLKGKKLTDSCFKF